MQPEAKSNDAPRRGHLLPPALAIVALLLLLWPCPAPTASHLAILPFACPFRTLTGLPCPLCGLSRSLVCLAHGHLTDAIRFHPLAPLLFLALILSCIRLPKKTLPSLAAISRYALGAAFLLVWLLRLAGILPAPP